MQIPSKNLKPVLIFFLLKIKRCRAFLAIQGTIFALENSARKQFFGRGICKMTYENAHQPVILLLDGSPSADNKFIKRWFQKSRFLTCECADLLDALAELSDFTTPQRPDVILLEIESVSADFTHVKSMTDSVWGHSEPTIFAFTESGKVLDDCLCFDGNLARLEAELNKMIPVGNQTRMTIAA